jgi:iron-sulfur cluster assembly protein
MIIDFKISITDKAAEIVKDTIESFEGTDSYLYLYVAGGGCSGLQYGLAVSEGEIEIDDIVINDNDIKIVVQGSSAKYVNGAVIDYTEGGMQTGFKIDNPNAAKTCGCSKSFNVSGEEYDTCGGCGYK